MADVFQTRCVSEGFLGSKHCLRVGCIGDSILYGQGVAPRHTLPAHLANFLNAAFVDVLVWTDNFGQSSGNLWHAWPRFKERSRSMKFDAVVFSVCHNDIQCFESNTIRYDKQAMSLWLDDGLYARQAVLLLEDVREHCSKTGIQPFIVFYTFVAADRPIIDRLGEICDRLDLPFVDMLDHFTTGTAITIASYRASEFDGHPSSLGHELAARRLTSVMQKRLNTSSITPLGADAGRVLAAALDDLTGQNVPTDAALAWAAEALAAKQRAVRRSAGRSPASYEASLSQLKERVEHAERAWLKARRLDTHVGLAQLPSADFSRALSQIYASVRNLDEILFMLEKTRDASDLASLGKIFQGGYYDERRRRSFLTDVGQEITRARTRLSKIEVLHDPEPPSFDFAFGSQLRRDTQAASSAPEVMEIRAIAARLASQLEALSRLHEAQQHLLSDEDINRLWRVAAYTAAASVRVLELGEKQFVKGSDLGAPVHDRWTSIDVVLKGGPAPDVIGRTCSLRVEAEYRVPIRMPICEQHWAGVEKDWARYHFEIPALLLGNVRVGVSETEPVRERFLRGTTRIAEIKIFAGALSDPARPPQVAVEWQNHDQNIPSVEFRDLVLP